MRGRAFVFLFLILNMMGTISEAARHRILATGRDDVKNRFSISVDEKNGLITGVVLFKDGRFERKISVRQLAYWTVICKNEDPEITVTKLRARNFSTRDGGIIELRFLREYNLVEKHRYSTFRMDLRAEDGTYRLYTTEHGSDHFDRMRFIVRRKFGRTAGIKRIKVFRGSKYLLTYKYD